MRFNIFTRVIGMLLITAGGVLSTWASKTSSRRADGCSIATACSIASR